MAHITGKDGVVKFKGITIDVTEFNATIATDDVEVTDTGSGGYQEFIAGIKRINGSTTFFYDTAQVPTSTIAEIVTGALVALELNPDSSGTDIYSGNAKISSMELSPAVADGIPCTISWVSSGTWVTP